MASFATNPRFRKTHVLFALRIMGVPEIVSLSAKRSVLIELASGAE